MKRFFLLVAMIMSLTLGAKAQWFDFSKNERMSIGLNVGVVGYRLDNQGLNTDYSDIGIGVSFSLMGVYADFIYQKPEHRYSSEVGVPDWNDHTALAINVGYQLPVLPWLFVTPLVGYSNETTGKTRANSITAENSSIVHRYDVEHRYHHFNYGVGIMVRPFPVVEIGAVATTHAIYGNISYSFSSRK